ncbi:phage holin family protein [bacterium]|nr:phage holin family protein [bacterium]
MRLLIRWIITAISLVVVAMVVPGITVEGDAWVAVAVMALVLGLVNAWLRPLLQLMACGLIVLTLGLALPFINGLTLWLSSYISVNWFGVGFVVDGFWPAFWGGIIVSIVSFLLSLFASDQEKD